MDSKDEIKKATREKKKSTKKSTKGKKGTKGKGKGKGKKGVEKSFVQKTPVDTGVPTGSGSLTGGARDVLGAGGIPGLLQALGVRGRFQGMTGTTGFGAPQLAPIQAPVVQRAPAVAPKLPDRIIEPPEENVVDRDVQRILANERRLERELRGLTRGDLIQRINEYFGDEGLDYIVKDEILSARTKKGMFEKIAEMDLRYGNVDIDRFISFTPVPPEDQFEESVGVRVAPALGSENGSFTFGIQGGAPVSNGFAAGGGDDMSALSMPGLEEPGLEDGTVALPEEAD